MYGLRLTHRALDICHDAKECTDLTFKDILLESKNIQFIWLDLKNLSSDNSHAVLKLLNKLDANFNIKSRMLIESGSLSTALLLLKKNGYNTSYYLPTRAIIDQGDIELANKILKHLQANQIPNISFDCRGYPFVKNILTPIFKINRPFYVWNIRYSYQKKYLISSLQHDDCISDENTKIALISYEFGS